jgi:glycosyltransferase involved in cell wall biosynthesis
VTGARGLALEPGVNVIGYLEAELGLGEAGRKLAAAVEAAGIPSATLTYRHTHSRQAHAFESRGPVAAPYDTNIICVNAAQLLELRKHLGVERFAGRYSIGVWFWELSRFPPKLHPAFDLVDEVWVASEFVRDSISQETNKPVLLVPLPLESVDSEPLSRSELEIPEGFLFLFTFDFLSVSARKNPLGVVEAFSRAFKPNEGPTLLIKSINGGLRKQDLAGLERAAAARPDVLVVDRYMTAAEKDALTASCDCYVSLHRSEGLGLTMAEAMAHAKPVIATGYSGNLTFMNEENSYLVRYKRVLTPSGIHPYPPGIEWAEPDLDHAAELMRHVYADREDALERGHRARCDIFEQHSLERSAAFIRRRLAQLPRHDELLREVRGPVERAAAIADQQAGSALAAPGRAGFLRRVMRRLLWPELEEQRRLDGELVQALRALERVTREELHRLQQERMTKSAAPSAGEEN